MIHCGQRGLGIGHPKLRSPSGFVVDVDDDIYQQDVIFSTPLKMTAALPESLIRGRFGTVNPAAQCKYCIREIDSSVSGAIRTSDVQL